MNKKYLILALAICSSLTICGCGKKETPKEYAELMSDKSGKVVKLGFYGSPEEIDPIKAAELEHDLMFDHMVFASPLRKTASGTYEAYLLNNFESRLEDGHLVVSGKWRQGLKWHDGKDFEPSEYDYTVKQMTVPEKNSPYADSAKSIISINNDLNNFEIKFSENSIKNLDMLCAGILPGHILEENKIASNTTVAEVYKEFIKKPIGLGPYKVTDNQKNKYYTLEPDVNFFDGKGTTRPKVVIACSYELQQSISDFRQGLLDWMSAPSMLAEQLQNLGVEDVVYVQYQNPSVLTWVFNTKNTKLSDVRIRKALNLIIDRECAKQSFGKDSTELFDNLIPVGENFKSASERFEEGKKILDELGITDKNGDGIRELNGEPFKLSILINNDNITRRMVADRIIENLKQVGIQGEIKSVAWNDFVAGKLKKGDFETALLCYHISNDCSMKSLFGSKNDQIDNLNFTGISDSVLDENLNILDLAVLSEDKEIARKKVNEKLSELCPCAFLIRPSNLALIHGSPVQTIRSSTPIWSDIWDWKLMFGKESSKL